MGLGLAQLTHKLSETVEEMNNAPIENRFDLSYDEGFHDALRWVWSLITDEQTDARPLRPSFRTDTDPKLTVSNQDSVDQRFAENAAILGNA